MTTIEILCGLAFALFAGTFGEYVAHRIMHAQFDGVRRTPTTIATVPVLEPVKDGSANSRNIRSRSCRSGASCCRLHGC